MNRFAVVAASLLAAFAAQAQIYQWRDQNNRTVISDRPPLNQARQQRTLDAEAPPPAAEKAGKTLADRELEFRQRQKDSRRRPRKPHRKRTRAPRKRRTARPHAPREILESGGHVALRDSQGERYFLDDRQREAELVEVRESVQANCR